MLLAGSSFLVVFRFSRFLRTQAAMHQTAAAVMN